MCGAVLSRKWSLEWKIQKAELPKEFSLQQNYPNPFNPTTTISYNLVKVQNLDKVMVSLRVYDILGREVATLVNEQKPEGTYTQKWNASTLSSGTYFYKLALGSNSLIKKMMLLK